MSIYFSLCSIIKPRIKFLFPCSERESLTFDPSWGKFGKAYGVPELAEVVMEFFQAALHLSSQKTYMTVLRAYTRFMNSLRGGVYLPFKRRILPETELQRVFFMALLLLKPTIMKASTILNHKTLWSIHFGLKDVLQSCARHRFCATFVADYVTLFHGMQMVDFRYFHW